MSNFGSVTLNSGSGGPLLACSTFVNGSPAQNELMPWTALAYLASGNANDTTGVFQTVGPANGLPISAAQSGAWSVSILAGSALIGQFEISDGTNVLGTALHPLVVSVNGSVTLAGTSAVSIADGANVTFGAEADAAAASDTATATYMALVKRELQHLSALIAQFPAALTGSGNFKVAIEESVTTVTVSVSGTTAVSGTVTANIGTTGGLALDATLTGGSAKAIARGGQKGTTNTNADITHTPSGLNHEALDVAIYDAAGNLLGTSGAPLRIDPTGTTTQNVNLTNATIAAVQSGAWTVTANAGTGTFVVVQSTAANLQAQVQGPAASGAAKSGNPVQGGAVFNTTQPTVTSGQVVESQATARGAHIVATGVDVFHVTMDNASVAVTQSGSWTATANQGTAAVLSGAWPVKVTDGTNTMPTGDSSARSIHTTLDNASIAVTQSGTWSLAANQSVNLSQVAGTTTSVNEGASDAGTQRVAIGKDDGIVTDSQISAAAVLSISVRASAGHLVRIEAFNSGTSPVFMRLYNQATAPASTDTPVRRFMIPGGSGAAGFIMEYLRGRKFTTGIGYRVTGGAADNDTTALAANQVIVNVDHES